MTTQTKTFKQPAKHIFFNPVFTHFNMIKTEMQLRKFEKDISDLDRYIDICTKKRTDIEKMRKECVSWRLKHSRN